MPQGHLASLSTIWYIKSRMNVLVFSCKLFVIISIWILKCLHLLKIWVEVLQVVTIRWKHCQWCLSCCDYLSLMPHILILNVEVSATFVTQKAEKVENHFVEVASCKTSSSPHATKIALRSTQESLFITNHMKSWFWRSYFMRIIFHGITPFPFFLSITLLFWFLSLR